MSRVFDEDRDRHEGQLGQDRREMRRGMEEDRDGQEGWNESESGQKGRKPLVMALHLTSQQC